MGHGKTGTIGGRSAERPTRSSTGNGRIVIVVVVVLGARPFPTGNARCFTTPIKTAVRKSPDLPFC